MKVVVIGADCPLGREVTAALQGREIPFVSISSHDPVLESVKLLLHAFTFHDATQVINVLSHEMFRGEDASTHKHSLMVTKNLAKACRSHDAVLIHLSGSEIHEGRRSGAYGESDRPDSADLRAKRMLKAESYVRKRAPKHIVLRCGPLIAASGDNLLTRVMRLLDEGRDLDCSDDKLCPTPAGDIARVIVAMVLQLDCGADPWGVYNYCSSDATTLCEFSDAVLGLAGQYGRIRTGSVSLHRIAGGERHVVLNCRAILCAFGIQQRPWRNALPALVAEYCRS